VIWHGNNNLAPEVGTRTKCSPRSEGMRYYMTGATSVTNAKKEVKGSLESLLKKGQILEEKGTFRSKRDELERESATCSRSKGYFCQFRPGKKDRLLGRKERTCVAGARALRGGVGAQH